LWIYILLSKSYYKFLVWSSLIFEGKSVMKFIIIILKGAFNIEMKWSFPYNLYLKVLFFLIWIADFNIFFDISVCVILLIFTNYKFVNSSKIEIIYIEIIMMRYNKFLFNNLFFRNLYNTVHPKQFIYIYYPLLCLILILK
jgi:hypothetical protein